MTWWIDETPWPGPSNDLLRVPKPFEEYVDPDGQVKGIIMRTDVSTHPTISGLGRHVRICCQVKVDSDTGSTLEFTEFYPEDEVDLESE